jgi:hypothetical protein
MDIWDLHITTTFLLMYIHTSTINTFTLTTT